MRLRSLFSLMMFGFMTAIFSHAAEDAQQDASFILSNDQWELTVEPRWGARLSSMRSLSVTQDFVACWGEMRTDRRGNSMCQGGILRSMMSGSYVSRQPEEPYKVVQKSATAADLVYDNSYTLLDGLREERRIALEGNQVVFSVKVTNTNSEARVIYYRIQDFAGVGLARGADSVFIVPRELGIPETFAHQAGRSLNQHVLSPAEPWYALADRANNCGLLVQFPKATPADIYFWVSGQNSNMRTAEVFFPQARLEPGQSWEMEARYTAFAPTAPQTGDARFDGLLSTGGIDAALVATAQRGLSAGAPLNAEMELPISSTAVTVVPVHPSDPVLGSSKAPNYGKTLKRIHLYGTPGEVASFAFAVSAADAIPSGTVVFNDLKNQDGGSIAATAFEPAYVAGESLVLVHDWALSRNIPETIGAIKNDVVDADALTPFTLGAGEFAPVWSRLRIPKDAAAGRYTGQCVIQVDGTEQAEFEIVLTVRSFKLVKPEDKTYGTFFVYFLKPQQGEPKGDNAQHAISREAYLEILKTYGDVGCNGFAIYVGQRDDLLWVLDRKRELGMNGADVLIYPHSIKPEDIKARNMTAYAWGVDEPAWYYQIPEVLSKYKVLVDKGWTPAFTPNLPLGLLLADQMEKMVPIINCNGNAPYLMAASKRYKDEGRPVFWYECYGLGLPSIEQRALRGIYLWKEPVDGILDWDNGSGYDKLSEHSMIAFAGSKPLMRLGLENTRQGLTDLSYLHTLELRIQACDKPVLRAEAEALMAWIRTYFDSNYHRVIPTITDPQYLDDVRQRVAEMIEKLAKP